MLFQPGPNSEEAAGGSSSHRGRPTGREGGKQPKRRSSDPGRVSKPKKHKGKHKSKHRKRSRSGSDSEGPVQLSKVGPCVLPSLPWLVHWASQELMHPCSQHLAKSKAEAGVNYSSVSGQRVRVGHAPVSACCVARLSCSGPSLLDCRYA